MERPAASDDRALRVGRLEAGDHRVDGRVAHAVHADLPAQLIRQVAHGLEVLRADAQPAIGVLGVVSESKRLADVIRLDAAINGHLHAAELHPVVAKARVEGQAANSVERLLQLAIGVPRLHAQHSMRFARSVRLPSSQTCWYVSMSSGARPGSMTLVTPTELKRGTISRSACFACSWVGRGTSRRMGAKAAASMMWPVRRPPASRT